MAVIVGLTGGIASGKSTVASMLRAHGVEIIDADQIAREIVQPGEEALAEIVATFGPEVLAADGTLDRAKLGARVFGDAEARAMLNGIMHPRIAQRMWRKAEAASAAGHRWVVYDAALLVENKAHHMLDSLIVVAASPTTQMQRVMARDGLSEADAQARIAAQLPLEQKIAAADYVIWNDGALSQTQASVDTMYAQIAASVAARGTAKPEVKR
jgi:dephospho-CoA kinase